MLDGRILVDCGPTAAHLPGGASLVGVEHVLVTHAHPDHLNPAVLLAHAWAVDGRPLHVWGPAHAIDLCRPWLGPDAAVDLRVARPGDVLVLSTDGGDYTVTVLPAEHHHGDGDALAAEALVFVVTAPDGHRLLYATDTGPLPASTIAAIGGRVDLALVDETFGDLHAHGRGHLDLASLPVILAALRAADVVDDRTLVAATHLSHHNPPADVLRARLGRLGVHLPDDFDVLDTSFPGGLRPGRTLVLGGARSGKSTRAEAMAARFAHVDYVATGGVRAADAEWAERVAAHRARRPPGWRTHETTDLADALAAARPDGCVLVDCLTLWLTSVLDTADAWARVADGDRAAVVAEVDRATEDLLAAIDSCIATVVLVSNEVGLGIVATTASGRLFADLLGRVNAAVAQACDEVWLLVAGRALALHGGQRR